MTAFKMPTTMRVATYTSPSTDGLFIDASTASQGYVTAGYVGINPKYGRLKFQLWKSGKEYDYDFEPSQKPLHCPVNMGDGEYYFRFMENKGGTTYSQVMRVRKDVKLADRFVPYTVPTVYCDYDVHGPCARISKLILPSCRTQTEALDTAYKWTAGYLKYDYEKAARVAGASGYVPSPDDTLIARRGICSDYASMCTAMLRCAGIPCRVVMGYVDGKYWHAWVVAYVDGKWRRRDPTYYSVLRGSYKASNYKYTNKLIY